MSCIILVWNAYFIEYRQWQCCRIGLRAGNLFHYLGEVDNELSEAAGIPGCVFVHLSGFVGGDRSYEG